MKISLRPREEEARDDIPGTAFRLSVVHNMLALLRESREARMSAAASSVRRAGQSMHLLVYLYSTPASNRPLQVTTMEFVLMDTGHNTFMLLEPQVL